MSEDLYELKKKKLELLQKKQEMKNSLPHLYGWPWYPWAKEFFDSKNQVNLLCAANQISKSSTQIRKCIDWATDMNKWDDLWGRKPNQFWYLYPSKEVATIEFEKKWEPEFMPRGDMKRDPVYGWQAEYDHKYLQAIHFNSGVSIYFKTYAQNPRTLQSGSCFAVYCDEELPVNLYDELNFRLAGTNGYFHMVFTATLNQEYWWRAMEAQGTDQEVLKDAWKRQVSMYDCLEYVGGGKTPWNVERIKKIEANCKSQAEVMRRVHGRFIKDEGRKFHAFDPTKHYCKPFKIPRDWSVYVGVDIGSGGDENHPAAIVFVAIKPDFEKGYVFKGWRGDGVYTTAGDVFEKYQEMVGNMHPVAKKYDWASKDFGTITSRLGESFTKADKSHELGEDIINTLFKNDMLKVFDTDELRKLGVEMLNLQKSTPKNKAKDDFVDAMRYAIVDAPWNFMSIQQKEDFNKEKKRKKSLPKTEQEWQDYYVRQRRAQFFDPRESNDNESWSDLDQEFQYWNEEYGN